MMRRGGRSGARLFSENRRNPGLAANASGCWSRFWAGIMAARSGRWWGGKISTFHTSLAPIGVVHNNYCLSADPTREPNTFLPLRATGKTFFLRSSFFGQNAQMTAITHWFYKKFWSYHYHNPTHKLFIINTSH